MRVFNEILLSLPAFRWSVPPKGRQSWPNPHHPCSLLVCSYAFKWQVERVAQCGPGIGTLKDYLLSHTDRHLSR